MENKSFVNIGDLKNVKFKIRNGQTGAYVCNADGKNKEFISYEQATRFIEFRRLTNVYEIEAYRK